MPARFTRRLIAAEPFESAGVFDVDGDGVLDIVSGAFWYQGPDFVRRHYIGPIRRVGEYYDDFSHIAMDVNGDGRLDFITCGAWSGTLRWRENPGVPGDEWPEHVIHATGGIETTRAWDVDGDGELELVPNTPGSPLAFYKLARDAQGRPLGRFTRHLVDPLGRQAHGLGFGDIDGDGRGELVVSSGWYSAPADPLNEPWTFHAGLDLGVASMPILVEDVDLDGENELIVGSAHGYGLDWYKRVDGAWRRHPIDPFCSQFHDLQWVDLDGDGADELVTGKRWRAHNDGDPGAHDEPGLYYYKWHGEGFAKNVIAHGPLGIGAGCGLHFATADLRGSGRLDIVAPGKDGLKVFFNEG
jgi:hypothetical protein